MEIQIKLIDEEINLYAETVYNQVFIWCDEELKNVIRNTFIKIENNATTNRQFLPQCDCLLYPVISDVKCAKDYSSEEKQKFDIESQKDILESFYLYKVQRLTTGLVYYIKLSLQAALYPDVIIKGKGLEYFAKQFEFVYDNFPEPLQKDNYRTFFCTVLERLKTDPSVILNRGFDGGRMPLGQYAIKELDDLKHEIGC